MTTTPVTLTIRASSAPLAWCCTESVRREPDEIIVEGPKPEADLGTAAHEYARRIRTEQDEPSVHEIARQFGVDPDDLGFLCAEVRRVVHTLDERTVGWKVLAEQRMSHEVTRGSATVRFTGTADDIRHDGKTVAVTDLKSGRVETDFTAQTMVYLWLAQHAFGPFEQFMPLTAWLRDAYIDAPKQPLSVEDVQGWMEAFVTRLLNGLGVFRPGPHCANCGRRQECPGRMQYEREVAQAIVVHCDALPSMEWTRDNHAALGPQIGELFGKLKFMQRAIEPVIDAIREKVKEFGPLPIGDGRVLKITEVNRRDLDSQKAMPILESFLSLEEIERATKISLSQIEQAVVSAAQKGQGAKIKRELTAALEAAQAIRITTTHQLREGKATE